MSHLFNVRGGAALAAACAALMASPGEARAEHESVGTIGLYMLTLAHTQLIPAYISTGHYAYVSSDPMPPAWATMNVITGTAAGSVGVAMMVIAVEVGDTDHGPRRTNNTEIVTGIFGGLTLAAGIGVSVLSIIQATRSDDYDIETPRKPAPASAKDSAKVQWSLLPSASIAEGGASSGGLTLIGTF
jgi:hypothetical protein